MLVLKPVGKGNWGPLVMRLDGTRAQPLLVRVGDRIELAGVTWRVCEVRGHG